LHLLQYFAVFCFEYLSIKYKDTTGKKIMGYKLSKKSLDKLQGVHPDLVKVVQRAIELTEVDFGITEGLRSRVRQEELFKSGKSQTMNSRHLTGKAVDVVAYKGTEISWDLELYKKISKAFKSASQELGVPIIWGGDWKTFIDGPHFELDRKCYL